MHFPKTTLVGMNASYSHTAFALYCLERMRPDTELTLIECTTSEHHDDVLRKLYETKADLYGFCSYIWNIEKLLPLIRDLKVLLPKAKMLLGGPEVSFDAKGYLQNNPEVDFVLCGEGEESFPLLFSEQMQNIPGLVYRDGEHIVANEMQTPNLEILPAIYEDFDFQDHKMYYYEASRGCPYRCSFCLSQSQKVRQVPLERVKEELTTLAAAGLDRIKFIDRTMNANPERFDALLSFIESIDNGHTNFHMEIHPAALKSAQIEKIKSLRKGLVQFEIGVQSTNPKTCEAIHRVGDTESIRQVVLALREADNVHLHLDLIAGLPYEDMTSFAQSFDDVMAMKPHKLQLGFLKLLHGTKLRSQAKEFQIDHTANAPYEVLRTQWLTPDELYFLHDVADLVDILYNEQWLEKTLLVLKHHHESWWALFESLAQFTRQQKIGRPTKDAWYDVLFQYGVKHGIDERLLVDILHYDAHKRTLHQPKAQCIQYEAWRIQDFQQKHVQQALEAYGGKTSDYYKKSRTYTFQHDVLNYNGGPCKQKEQTLLFVAGDIIEL